MVSVSQESLLYTLETLLWIIEHMDSALVLAVYCVTFEGFACKDGVHIAAQLSVAVAKSQLSLRAP